MAVTQDATSGWYVPQNATEWTELLAGTGIPVPTRLWLMQDTSAPYVDALGGVSLTDEGSRHDNHQTVTGWTRKGQRSRGDAFLSNDSGFPDPSTHSQMALTICIFETAASPTETTPFLMGNQAAHQFSTRLETNGKLRAIGLTTAAQDSKVSVTHDVGQVVVYQSNVAAGVCRCVTKYEVVEVAIDPACPTGKGINFSGAAVANGSIIYLYNAAWDNADAEITSGQMRMLEDLIRNGPLAGRSAIPRDATSGWYCPVTVADWFRLLEGTGIQIPDLLWLCQESSGTLLDSFGTGANGEVIGGTPTYANSVTGWTRKAVLCRQAQADTIRSSSGQWVDDSGLAVAYVVFPDGNHDGNPNNVISWGPGYASQVTANLKISTVPGQLELATHGDSMTGGSHDTVGFHPIILKADKTNLVGVVQTDLETLTHSTAADNFSQLALGGNNINFWLASGCEYMFVAAWAGRRAEMDATHRADLLDRLQNGPPSTGGGLLIDSALLVSPLAGRNRIVGGFAC